MICECGIEFKAKRGQRFHSRECKVKHHNEKHRRAKRRLEEQMSDVERYGIDPHRLLSAKWDRELSL